MLAWLSVWSEVQTCIWPSGFHCHSLFLASGKSRLVLPFWYQLTQVVPDNGPLNGCVCVFLLMTVTVVTVTRLIFCNICLKVAFIFDSQASPFGGRPMSEIASRYPYEKCTFGGTYVLLTIDSSSLCVCFMQSSNQYQYHAAGASHSHNVMRLVPTISVATSSCWVTDWVCDCV